MATNSIELQVIDNVIATLSNVSEQDPDFEQGIGDVTTGTLLETAFDGSDVVVGVYPGVLIRELTKSMAGKHEAFNTFEIKIEGAVRGDIEDILQKAAMLKADIERALWVDRRRGITGKAIDTISIRYEPQPPLNTGGGATLQFLATLTVTWIAFLGTP